MMVGQSSPGTAAPGTATPRYAGWGGHLQGVGITEYLVPPSPGKFGTPTTNFSQCKQCKYSKV